MEKFRRVQGPKIKRDSFGKPVSVFEKYAAIDGTRFSLRTQKTRCGEHEHELEYVTPDGKARTWVGDLITLLTLPQINQEIREALYAHEKTLMPKNSGGSG